METRERTASQRPSPTLSLAIDDEINIGDIPFGLAAGEDAVWAAGARGIYRIDPATGEVVDIPLPDDFAGKTLAPGEPATNWPAVGAGAVWVSQPSDALRILRVDPATKAVVAVIDAGEAPTRPAPLAVGEGAVWATNFEASTVTRIDADTNEVVATIATTDAPEREDRGRPSGVAITAGAVWVMNHRERALIRIDPATNEVVATIPTSADGRVAAGEGSVWVAGAGRPFVDRIDPETDEVTAVVKVTTRCRGLHDIAVGATYIWVTSEGGVCRIDPATNEVAFISLPVSPVTLAHSAESLWLGVPGPPVVTRTEPTP